MPLQPTRFIQILIAFTLMVFTTQIASGQPREIIGGNIVNTTMTGALLGAATLGLQGGTDYAPPLRVGVGVGILTGVALAGYDMVAFSANGSLLVEGTFISGNNTGLILLIDTIYGGLTGAVIGTAIILISNRSLVDGLQYGASIGAWAGFSYSLVDAFALNRRTAYPEEAALSSSLLAQNTLSNTSALGGERNVEWRLLQPRLADLPTLHSDGRVQRDLKGTLEIVGLTLRF